jgi:hypothetical protein
LQQGSLAIGNTLRNKTALYNLCVTEANTNGIFAKWRTVLNTAKIPDNLLLNVPLVPGYVAPPGGQPAGGGGLLSVVITAGNITSEFGWATAGDHFFPAMGSVTPSSPMLNGEPLVAVMYANSVSRFYVGVEALVAQNFFTSVSFVDQESNLETYATASPLFYGQISSRTTHWEWTSLIANPFTSGNEYTITFS